VRELGQSHVVVTGGEPLLFEAVVPFLAGLREFGHVITVETAGTVFREIEVDLLSVSPKLANSKPDLARAGKAWVKRHEETRLDRGPLKELLARYPYQLKFVVRPENLGEIEEIEEILSFVGGVEPERVFLMAEGVTRDDLLRRQKLLVPISLEKGWRIAPRFHIDLFGDTRGT
jgi:7-carboxy-7-deazaguanine synthase